MYLSHYNLKEKPFQISTDPKFIWLGENHQEALAVLEYGVIENKGFLLITGDVGTGKTTLINALLMRMGTDVIVANITNPILEELDFFNIVANEFNINKHFSNKADFLIHFSRFLKDCYTKKKKVILVIDEAHKLDQDLLEQIRLLSNIERQDTKLINIFFVGQNEFIDIISDKQKRALRQRITINYHLDSLKKSEVEEYILHRLNVAGLKENIFNDNSISEIYSFSNGYPRLINIICDQALLTGYVKGVKIIDGEIIKECATGLFLTKKSNDYYKNDLKTTQEAIPATKKEPTITPSEYTDRYNLPEERITHEFVKEPTPKISGKNFGYLAGIVLCLIMLGFIYYPGNLGGQIYNIKNYFKPVPNVQEKIERVKDLPPDEDFNQEKHPDRIYKSQEVPEHEFITTQRYIINFRHNSYVLPEKGLQTLEQIKEFLVQHPKVNIIVKGHTDSYGNYKYNKKLSKLRANFVKSYFVNHGINFSRIKAFGIGQKNPIGSNKTIEGRRRNRRVEIKLNINKTSVVSG